MIGNFCKPLKPFLSDKIKHKEPISLVNNVNLESTGIEVAKTFNEFFSNIATNLEIPEYQCAGNLHSRLSSNPVLQAIMKYRYHPSSNIIRRYSQCFPSFYFSVIDKNTVRKETKKLSVKKAIQDTNIPVKVLKENEEIFAEQIYLQFNEGICASHFTTNFKFAYLAPAFKQGFRNIIGS